MDPVVLDVRISGVGNCCIPQRGWVRWKWGGCGTVQSLVEGGVECRIAPGGLDGQGTELCCLTGSGKLSCVHESEYGSYGLTNCVQLRACLCTWVINQGLPFKKRGWTLEPDNHWMWLGQGSRAVPGTRCGCVTAEKQWSYIASDWHRFSHGQEKFVHLTLNIIKL